jgi:hypothetical protein
MSTTIRDHILRFLRISSGQHRGGSGSKERAYIGWCAPPFNPTNFQKTVFPNLTSSETAIAIMISPARISACGR